MPKVRLLLIAALACSGPSLCSCGGSSSDRGVAPVALPETFSEEVPVQRLVEAKWKAVAADPSNAALHRSLGMALAANGGSELAEGSYLNALELDPDDHESRFQLAAAFAGRGDIESQVQELRAIIAKDSTFYAAHYALGCALLDLGELDEAASMFQAVKLGIGSTLMGELGLGLVALARDKPEVALPLLTAAASRYPDDTFIRFQIGQAYLDCGEEKNAKRVLSGLQDAGGRMGLNSPGASELRAYAVGRGSRMTRALELIERDQHAAAIPILEALASADPADSAAANNLHAAYMGVGRFDDALRIINDTIERSPDQYQSYINRAVCLLRLAEEARKAGRVLESRDELQDALLSSDEGVKRAPRLGQARRVRAQILAALRRDPESVQAFRKAIELGETSEDIFVELSVPLGRYSGVAALEALFHEALQHDGARPRVRFELCGVLLKTGRGAEARGAQRELARLAPGHQYATRADQILGEQGY